MEWLIPMVNVGKYNSRMDGMGKKHTHKLVAENYNYLTFLLNLSSQYHTIPIHIYMYIYKPKTNNGQKNHKGSISLGALQSKLSCCRG